MGLATKGYENTVRRTLSSGLSNTCNAWDEALKPSAVANKIMVGDGALNIELNKPWMAIVGSIVAFVVFVILAGSWMIITYAPWPTKPEVASKFDRQDAVIETNRRDAAAVQAQQVMINGQILDQLKGLSTTIEANRKDAANRADLSQDSTQNNSDSIIQMQQLLMDKGLMLPRDVPKRRLR